MMDARNVSTAGILEPELTLEVIKAVKTLLRFAGDNGFHAGVRIDHLGGLGLLGDRKRKYFPPLAQDMAMLQLES